MRSIKKAAVERKLAQSAERHGHGLAIYPTRVYNAEYGRYPRGVYNDIKDQGYKEQI